MKCPHCGAEEVGRFCSYCGSEIPKQKNNVNVIINNSAPENTNTHLNSTAPEISNVHLPNKLYYNDCNDYVENKGITIKPKLYNNAIQFVLNTEKIFYIGTAYVTTAYKRQLGVMIVTDEKVLFVYKRTKIIIPIISILSLQSKKRYASLTVIIENCSGFNTFFSDDALELKRCINNSIAYNKYQKQRQNQSNNTYINNINAVDNNINDFDKLVEYKKLLDTGVINQEEFNTLKKRLLNL
jgi:hypothetical protein